MDNAEVVQGRLIEGKVRYAFFNVKKAYDTVWCDGFWLKLWEMGKSMEGN